MYKFTGFSAITLLLPLVHSAVLPAKVVPREDVHVDVIRMMKCAALFDIKPEGGWEQGMAGWWVHESDTGAPADMAIFDLHSAELDFFYTDPNKHYEAKSNAGTDFVIDTVDPGDPNPPNGPDGVWVGHAVFGSSSYNCLTDKLYTYEDAKYGTCNSYVRCLQKDALKVSVSASNDTIRVEDLPPANEIYAHLTERFNTDSHICDTTPVDLGTSQNCKVHFDCNDNDINAAVLPILRTQMDKFGSTSMFVTEVITDSEINAGCSPACYNDVTRTYRTMPTFTKIIARGVPQDDSRLGYEVASIEAHITCDPDPGNAGVCSALGSVFSIGALIPDGLDKVFGFAGAALDTACSATGDDD
ncbi:uncharacterized protein BDZ99DRAFT_473529 [Mytilinidion resinicola]|uniref:Uncharacterized protein n=1 Tax=Mytilinidion resinicola TaxID=574789 RepID=A0A6A6Z1D2_9PEZI|nr:uncharacterized protein BDZ99DRAFT_473529 [Mytilinidion resinicola]KAF2814473.1 hypothetical protein BDZ99DRAFT_473529 [Mytilinidion resinicola]